MTGEDFKTAVEALKAAKQDLDLDLTRFLIRKADAEKKALRYVREGLAGKNEKEREANLALLMEDDKKYVDLAEEVVRTSRMKVELAQLDLDLLRYKLRLLEATKSV